MKPLTATSAFFLIAFATASIAQDKVSTVPVAFAKGSSSASLKGNLGGYDSVNYTLGAKGGQTMTVKISGSSNANFNVFAPGDRPGSSTALGSGSVGSNWSGKLPTSGTYTIQVYQMRASARRGEQVPFNIAFQIH
ncbi:g-type lysozyme inhibitor [Lysobacter arenosi]|uniref:G-type lysozyme inhibitor n=1 Tax=Lysobacter arenosi TaxID=2795387 RepID=A0ABX7R5V6_9GAMM|nr:g-type lysozyme inhibitor [Lysobacter arenosi]QSX73503.1 g-type lysozyme inhibitor [Lysobacter arenosi]